MFSVYLHTILISGLDKHFLGGPVQINMVARLLFALILSFIFTFNSIIFTSYKQRPLDRFISYLQLLAFLFSGFGMPSSN